MKTESRPGGPDAVRILRRVALLVALAGSTHALAQNAQPVAPTAPGAQPAATPENAGVNGAAGGGEVRFSNPARVLGPGEPVVQPREQDRPAPESKVTVDDNLIVDLHVADEDLANVLEMLSIQSRKNIIASKDVAAQVTANLYGVTFFEALDAILHVNGYGYIERGNFIYIYTLEELKAIEQANRQRVSKVIRLNYLSATDAAEFVKPLLAEGGQIKSNGKTGTFPSMGDTPVGADEYANDATLVVFDFEENVAEIEKLLQQLDTRPAQVLVEATILQTALNEANAFGVDFSIIGDLDFADFVNVGGPFGTVDALRNGRSGSNALPSDGRGGAVVGTAGNTGGPATLKAGVTWNEVSVIVRLLDEVTDTTILSNPKILALNRQPARVLVGRKVGYLSSTTTDTSTTQTVQFLNTGTQLNFRPFVSSDGNIRMELKPQVSEAVIRDTRDSTGNTVTIPDEITNELTTNVIVRDGQTIVLGGLFRESTESTRRQVPFLGDVPIIGSAFRGREDETQRSEIIFLIRPTVVNDQTLADMGADAADYADRMRAGSRAGLLPWSRDRMTGALLVEAEQLAAEGRTEQALHKVSRALRLSPNQPEALALRQRLGGERPRVWERSMLNRIMDTSVPGVRADVTPAGVDLPATEPVTTPAPDATAFTPPAQPAPTPAEPAGDVSQPAPTDVANTQENPLQSNAQPLGPSGAQPLNLPGAQPLNQSPAQAGQLPPVIAANPSTNASTTPGTTLVPTGSPNFAPSEQVSALGLNSTPTPSGFNPFSRIFSGARVLLKSPTTTGDNTSTLTNASEPARDNK